jgi:hypothetical protein
MTSAICRPSRTEGQNVYFLKYNYWYVKKILHNILYAKLEEIRYLEQVFYTTACIMGIKTGVKSVYYRSHYGSRVFTFAVLTGGNFDLCLPSFKFVKAVGLVRHR